MGTPENCMQTQGNGETFVPFGTLAEQMNAAARQPPPRDPEGGARHACVEVESREDRDSRRESASHLSAVLPLGEGGEATSPEGTWISRLSWKRSAPRRRSSSFSRRWRSWKRDEGESEEASDVDDYASSRRTSSECAKDARKKRRSRFLLARRTSLVGRVKRRSTGTRRRGAARWVRQTSSRARSFVAEKAVATFGAELDLYTGRNERRKELRRTSKTSIAFSSEASGLRGVASVGSKSHPFSLLPLKFRDEQLESEYVATLNELCSSRVYTCFGVFVLVLVVLWPSMGTSFSLSLHQAEGIGCRLFHLLWIAKLISWFLLLITVSLRNKLRWISQKIIPFATMQITWGFILVIAFCCAYVTDFIERHNDKISQINQVYETHLVRGPLNRRKLVTAIKTVSADRPVDLGLFTLAEDFVASLSLLMLLTMVESLVTVVCLGSLIPTRTRYTWPLYLVAPFLCPIPCVICNAIAPAFILGSTTVVYYFVSITVWLVGFIVRYSSECSQRVAFYSRVAPRKEIENLKNSLRRSQRHGGCTAVEELQHTAKCMEAVVKQLEGTCMAAARDFVPPVDAEGRANVQELALLLTKLQDVLRGTDDLYSVRHTPFMLETTTGQELLELYGTNMSRQATLSWAGGGGGSVGVPTPALSPSTSLEGPRFYGQSKSPKCFAPSLPSAFGVLPGLNAIHQPPLRQHTDPVRTQTPSLISPVFRRRYQRHTSDRGAKKTAWPASSPARAFLRGSAASSCSLHCGPSPSIAEAPGEEEEAAAELKRRDENRMEGKLSPSDPSRESKRRAKNSRRSCVATASVTSEVVAGPTDKLAADNCYRENAVGQNSYRKVQVKVDTLSACLRKRKAGSSAPHSPSAGCAESHHGDACSCHQPEGEGASPCSGQRACLEGFDGSSDNAESVQEDRQKSGKALDTVWAPQSGSEPSSMLVVPSANWASGDSKKPLKSVAGRGASRQKVGCLGLRCFGRRSRRPAFHPPASLYNARPCGSLHHRRSTFPAVNVPGRAFAPSLAEVGIDASPFYSLSPHGGEGVFQHARETPLAGRSARWSLRRGAKSSGKSVLLGRLRGNAGSKGLELGKQVSESSGKLKVACSLNQKEIADSMLSRGKREEERDEREESKEEWALGTFAFDDKRRRGSASCPSLGGHENQETENSVTTDHAFEERDLLGLNCAPLKDASCRIGPPCTRSSFLPSSEAQMAIGQVWDFDMLSFAALSPNPLVEVGLVLLLPEIDSLHCCTDQEVIVLLQNLQARYLQNPYHSQVHAAEVVHTAACLMRCLIPQRSAFANLCTLVAAAAHDVGHPARTNLFLQNLLHPLSIVYNDVSTLENFHSALLFRILSEIPDSNVFSGLPQETFRIARQNIITLILATDIKQHFETISRFRLRRNSPEFNFLKKEEDDWLVRKMIFKIADISHATVAWDAHFFWSCKVNAEFYAQGDAEVRLGLPVSPLCDREKHFEMGKSQVAFLNFVVEPLLRELEAIEALVLPLGTCPIISTELLPNFAENVQQWKAIDTEKKLVILERVILDYGGYGAVPPLTESQRRQLISECCRPLEGLQESACESLRVGPREV
ncbi:3'5'-cyclic nucleotide phosphodiesterase domain-containing protein [Toxoplasma gondii CAST]|uniref:Phosphodiesterase n=1 Tax=Toxoplasma gondii CAST TaxID=943122 RepID=A0A3R7YSX4_TOXGO|nr:3'5'-cyclic nucleotide phosphodiesterase domain-containing protein [Toxoplasma gondii CAST]